ncbi:MAG: hypothetical protein KAI79_03875 [Bacteroidales bacterium]|nr:hypothetical protein [Bacteroidales bacterium]
MKILGKDEIIIERNAEGIPKVVVKNELDLYFGMGYCHAMEGHPDNVNEDSGTRGRLRTS